MTESKEIIQKLLSLKGWKELNPVQRKAFDEGVIDQDTNFVILAPTASGKTGIAELAILQELEKNGKIVYTVPSHALINDKLKDFEYLAKQEHTVKEGTSSYSRWVEADLIITTFELLYRACLRSKNFLDDFRLVVVDEFHILYDKMRGYNLEKVLTILKEFDIRLICLSATFEDKDEIGEWLEAKVVHIPRELRPVSITHDMIDLRTKPSQEALCQALIEKHHEPYLIFCSTKPYTRNRAIEMCRHISGQKNDSEEIIKEVKRLISREEIPELERNLCSCLTKGVGFHHSDLHRNLRNFVADLFKNRQIDYLFCTTGLAYGINFPTKSVVISDLTLWDSEEGSKPIPNYLYLQMGGRAGRPQYDDEGFCYLIIKKDNELTKVKDYREGILPRAVSQIGYDEYFRKSILELIYSARNTDEEIIGFFVNSLFNFQAIKQKNALIPYNLGELIQNRIKWLHSAGFLERLGINYELTDFGQVTLDYLFRGFSSPELSSFFHLNQYLEQEKSVKSNFELIYFLSKTFPDCRISKQPYKKSREVLRFLQSKSITEKSHAEYSAYVVYNKWMDNVSEVEIDDICKVYSSNLPSKMWEMYKLLGVYEELARRKHYPIPEEFQVFKERIRYGVREDELQFVKIHGIGRETAGSLRRYCYDVLQRNMKYSGTPVDILTDLLVKEGEERFLGIHTQYIKYVGPIKAKRILSFIKSKLNEEKREK